MTASPPRHGLGDPRIPWVVLLDLRLAAPPPPADVLTGRLTALADEAGWPAPGSAAIHEGSRDGLLGELAGDSPELLRAGRYGDGLVLAARHDALDGLGMLTAAGRLLDLDLRSTARGVEASRASTAPALALLRRGWEIAFRPSARVAPSATSPRPGEAFAATTIDASPRTADLVRAGAAAVARWNAEHGRSTRRISVAVGVSRAGGASSGLADRSAFLRLRDVERMDVGELRTALAQAPLQIGGGGSASALGAIAVPALRLAAPRLGSTLLVSHLGELQASEAIDCVAFYPVTGGGSGLSLGAAGVRGRTTLTLRGRAGQHDDAGLQRLLTRVVDVLDG